MDFMPTNQCSRTALRQYESLQRQDTAPCVESLSMRGTGGRAYGSLEHRRLVAYRLELALEAIGVTKSEAARAIGVSPSKIGNWTAHNREVLHYPDPELLSRLCDRFGLTMDYLYRGVTSASVPPAVWDASHGAARASGAAPAPSWEADRASEGGASRRPSSPCQRGPAPSTRAGGGRRKENR
jgi:transcriptional regulator with XRE-family HTH domain